MPNRANDPAKHYKFSDLLTLPETGMCAGNRAILEINFTLFSLRSYLFNFEQFLYKLNILSLVLLQKNISPPNFIH